MHNVRESKIKCLQTVLKISKNLVYKVELVSAFNCISFGSSGIGLTKYSHELEIILTCLDLILTPLRLSIDLVLTHIRLGLALALTP